MAKVLYYNANKDATVFDVLKENGDGTVDIGTGGKLAVGSCKLVVNPTPGHAVRCLPTAKKDAPVMPEAEAESEVENLKPEKPAETVKPKTN